jgi:hypothetical protein
MQNPITSTWPSTWATAEDSPFGTIDLQPGVRFGRLTVIKRAPNVGSNRAFVMQCDCGVVKTVQGRYLRLGKAKSCGCLNVKTVDGAKKSDHPLYLIWKNMVLRTTKRYHKGYEACGALGIRVCERWHTFENWLEDIGPRPKNTMLCRLNRLKDYEPGNTAWLTAVQRRAAYHPKKHDDRTNPAAIQVQDRTARQAA